MADIVASIRNNLVCKGNGYHLIRLKSLLTAFCAIIIVFVAMSIIDVILAVLFPRFYSAILFIITFGIAGVFAAAFSYEYGMEMSEKKTSADRAGLIILQIITGITSFLFLSEMEGGEYEAAFKAFGAALALGSLLYIRPIN